MTETLLQPAKTCELHIHMGGGVFAEDLLDLAAFRAEAAQTCLDEPLL